MTALSALAFAVLVWGVIALVLLVFVYEVYVIATDMGWISARSERS